MTGTFVHFLGIDELRDRINVRHEIIRNETAAFDLVLWKCYAVKGLTFYVEMARWRAGASIIELPCFVLMYLGASVSRVSKPI